MTIEIPLFYFIIVSVLRPKIKEVIFYDNLFYCRDDWIRTSDLFVPNEARYRAALHPVHIECKKESDEAIKCRDYGHSANPDTPLFYHFITFDRGAGQGI